jgi:peptidoglycan/xylan/chitin deacetylase (PgdA/CDA1 family)
MATWRSFEALDRTMPFSLTSAARNLLRVTPLPVYRRVIRRDVLIFLYHIVGPPDIAHVRHLYPYKTPEAFERDLIYLARRFRMVPYDEIESGRGRIGRPAAHVTFDDGYAECDSVARPILLKMGIPCTFFLTTDLIDNRAMFHRNKASLCADATLRLSDGEASAFLRVVERCAGRPLPDRDAFRRWALALGPLEEVLLDEACTILEIDIPAYLRRRRPYLSTEQIRRLVTEGFTLGAHGRRHVPLGSLAEPAAEEEIVASCQTLCRITGRNRVPFAFPHSADGVSRAFLRGLAATRPSLGLMFDTHRLLCDDEGILNRITADAPPVSDARTNLPRLLRAAYAEAASDWLRRTITTPFRRVAAAPKPGSSAKG